jgi:hypothetical protein
VSPLSPFASLFPCPFPLSLFLIVPLCPCLCPVSLFVSVLSLSVSPVVVVPFPCCLLLSVCCAMAALSKRDVRELMYQEMLRYRPTAAAPCKPFPSLPSPHPCAVLLSLTLPLSACCAVLSCVPSSVSVLMPWDTAASPTIPADMRPRYYDHQSNTYESDDEVCPPPPHSSSCSSPLSPSPSLCLSVSRT